MLLTALATLGGIGTAIASAIGSAENAKKAIQTAERGYNETDTLLRSRYNADITKRSDFQALMTKQKELADAQYIREKGANAVVGGNDSAVFAQKVANANAQAQVMSNAGANAQAEKNAIQSQIIQNKQAKTNLIAGEYNRKAQTIAQAGGNSIKAMFGLVEADEGQLDKLVRG